MKKIRLQLRVGNKYKGVKVYNTEIEVIDFYIEEKEFKLKLNDAQNSNLETYVNEAKENEEFEYYFEMNNDNMVVLCNCVSIINEDNNNIWSFFVIANFKHLIDD